MPADPDAGVHGQLRMEGEEQVDPVLYEGATQKERIVAFLGGPQAVETAAAEEEVDFVQLQVVDGAAGMNGFRQFEY